MVFRKSIGILSIALCSAGWIAASNLHASTDGFSLKDLELHSAGALVDVCSIAPEHEHYATALAFCYGFFEGAIRYAEAITGASYHKKLVCAPPGTTRVEAVEVFVTYMNDNSDYLDEAPIDGIYRALIPRWPCEE
jgi:hypothetical protein